MVAECLSEGGMAKFEIGGRGASAVSFLLGAAGSAGVDGGCVFVSCGLLFFVFVLRFVCVTSGLLLLVGIPFVWGITEDPMLIDSTHDPGATTTSK